MASETDICNMALGKLGAERITSIDDSISVPAQRCRLHYDQTRDSLLRSYFWRFALDRKTLAQDTTDPIFEWDNQFILPTDYLRLRSIEEETGFSSRHRRHAIEGQRFLTNFSSVNMRYLRKVVDPTQFDPLFVEILVLRLAQKLIPALGKTDPNLTVIITNELKDLMPKVQAVTEDEIDTGGRSDWNLARHGGIGITGPERFL